MLVLTRRPNESVIIDGNIKVSVLLIQGGKVRIGIEAPPDLRIVREELLPFAATTELEVAAKRPALKSAVSRDLIAILN